RRHHHRIPRRHAARPHHAEANEERGTMSDEPRAHSPPSSERRPLMTSPEHTLKAEAAGGVLAAAPGSDSTFVLHPTSLVLPVLPLKTAVLFPGLFTPLAVGRPHSIAAVEAALATEEKTFVVVAQRDGNQEQTGWKDLYSVGTRAVVKKMARGEG